MVDGQDNGDDEPQTLFGGAASVVVPSFVRERFAVKFFLAIFVVVVLIAGVGTWGFFQSQDVTEDNAKAQLSTTAGLQADSIGQWYTGMTQETQLVSESDIFGSDDTNSIAQYLRNHRTSGVVDIHYYDPEAETVIASTNPPAQGGTPANAQEWNQAIEKISDLAGSTSTVVGAVDTAYETEGQPVLAFASPTPSGDGYVVLVGSIQQQVQSLASEEGSSTTTVLNADGEPVVAARGGVDPSALAARDEFSRAREGEILTGETGEEVLAFAPVADANWVAITAAPKSEVFAVSQTVSQTVLAIVGAGLVSLVVVGLVFGRQTVVSITRLRKRAQTMADGDLDVSLSTSRVDEVGQLYGSFQVMADSLAAQIDEAEQARKEAEVSRAEALEMSNYLQQKADEYAEIMRQCAAGDLTQRMDPDGENEAMDRIAEEFNDMIGELERTTGQLKGFADQVGTAGEEVQHSADTVRDVAEDVADSVQRISDDAHDQKERLDAIAETIDGIAADLESFAAEHDVDFQEDLDRIEEVATTLEQVVELSEETMAEAEEVAGATEEQAAELNEVSDRAGDLTRYARPLREVLDRFETEAEREFYFPTGPGSPPASESDTED